MATIMAEARHPEQAFAVSSASLRQSALLSAGVLARTAIIAGGLLLSACQVVPKNAPTTPPPQTNPTGPAIQPGLPTDTTRHRIALLVPQTGPDAAVGQSIANATTMAILDTRSDRVRITTYDTGRGVAAAAQQALADGNKLILGPLLADDVRTIAPIVRPAKVPVISFSNDTRAAGDGVFIIGSTPEQSVDRVVRYARTKGMTRFASLSSRTPYGERAAAAMRSAVTATGGTLVVAESYDRTAAAMSGAIRRLSNSAAYDAILIADSGNNAIRAVPLVRQFGGANAQILGTELWNTEASLAASAPMRGAWFASVSDGLYTQLATKYRERYGNAPHRLASLGYDAVLLTVRIARDWRPGTDFPTDRLLAEDGFGGIDGLFRFSRNGQSTRALEVTEVRAGGFAVVDPSPTKW